MTREAAEQFAKLANLLRAYGEDPHRTAHFLIRLLFCLFAEDIGLLPDNLFTRLITQTRHKAPAFTAQLKQLFAAMATGGWFGPDEISHFNGGLFDADDLVLQLDSEGLDILAKVAAFDWGNIEPSILGTLFERSLDPAKRSQLGAHYTSREDILLIVEPVLMAPLRRRWAAVQAEAAAKAAARDVEPTPRKRVNRHKELTALLTGFAAELAEVKVLDPACGSGNFLYVALKQLLDLQKAVINIAAELGVGHFFPSVTPQQLYGLELNPYAHELAQTTVWIGHIQWLRDNGFGHPGEPILKPIDNIKQMDAILAYDADGQPVEPAWPAADVIIGNPPFLGGSKLRRELGDKYLEAIWQLYDNRVPGGADLVTYWFERARAMIENGTLKRAGLLSTNSIRGAANRKILERIKASGDIFMAHSDRPWVLDGAAVRVSMVGFDDGGEGERTLDGQMVETINPDLTSTTDLTQAQRLPENGNLAFVGSQKIGPFDITAEQARTMLDAPLNPNGRPNSDVIKLSVNAQDMMGNSRNVWIIDFGTEITEEEAALYELPFEYVKEHVYPVRVTNNDQIVRLKWWLHGRSRPSMRAAIAGLSRYIITPRVAKHRVFCWLTLDALPDHKVYVIAREDDYFFGILQSRLHEVWTLNTCTWHGVGNDPVYSGGNTFETFPFPWPPGAELQDNPLVQAIAAAAQELVEKRANWLNPPGASATDLKKRTLTNLYNQRPTWLELAHQQLDAAVLAAYNAADSAQEWAVDITDEQILAQLLHLNLRRAGQIDTKQYRPHKERC